MTATIRVIPADENMLDAVEYYCEKNPIDYYLDGLKQCAYWFGKAASLLGFIGKPTKTHLQNAFIGRSANGDQIVSKPFTAKHLSPDALPSNQPVRLRALSTAEISKLSVDEFKSRIRQAVKQKRRPVAAVDVTFSVPKSVSILWMLLSRRQRMGFLNVVRRVIENTLRQMETTIPLTRRGRGGLEQCFAHLAAALFFEMTSRNNDPQLHVHCVIPNIVKGLDGRWSRLNTSLLHHWMPTIGRIFRANLAHELQNEFGLKLTRPLTEEGQRESWFEVAGVPEELIKAFSTRRQQILDEAGPAATARGTQAARKRQQANLRTRQSKEQETSLDVLIPQWRKLAQEHEFGPEQAQRLMGQAKSLSPTKRERLYKGALRAAVATLEKSQSHYAEHELIREVIDRLQHVGIEGNWLANRVADDLRNSPQFIQLGPNERVDQFTSKAMWQLEERLIGDVEILTGRDGICLPPKRVSKQLAKHQQLSVEQRQAISQLLTEKSAIRTLSGVAGSGKSTAFRVVNEAFEKAGYKVLGGALAGAAAQELHAKTGMESRTVASHLWRYDKSLATKFKERFSHDVRMFLRELSGKSTWNKQFPKLDSKTVLVIDEAGMLDSKTLSRLVHIARKAGATLVLGGDDKQLSPIGPGGPFSRLIQRHGNSNLQENLRQTDVRDQVAVQDIRNGDVASALADYAARGRVTIAESKTAALDAVVEEWIANAAHKSPAKHLILTQTRADAQKINRFIQLELHDLLDAARNTSVRINDQKFFVGDRILFQRAERLLGIENGNFGEVVAIDRLRSQISIRLDRELSPNDVAKGLRKVVTLQVNKATEGLFSLGFAATTHKLQGQTVDNAYVILGGRMSNKEMLYTQATRAKLSTRFFVDRESAGPDLVDLIKSLERSRQKKMAHDIRATNGVEHSLNH